MSLSGVSFCWPGSVLGLEIDHLEPGRRFGHRQEEIGRIPCGRGKAQVEVVQAAAEHGRQPWRAARLERGGVLVEQATLTDNGDKTVGVALLLRTRVS